MIAARVTVLAACLLLPAVTSLSWVRGAEHRLREDAAAATGTPDDAIAAPADVGYCSPELKKILRRVLQSCGLLGGGGVRGCQPLEAKNVATVSGDDFNALFKPMRERGAIIEFDQGKGELGAEDLPVVDAVFADQRGASYFFVVARASPDGGADYNRRLSKQRAEAVMAHLRQTFADPDLDREVGLLWLGEEFAQLDREFCEWKRSGPAGEACRPADINRSAFVAWIDCQL
jgi:outer membrane protein OmpA-like peptidoglycan-associated protein